MRFPLLAAFLLAVSGLQTGLDAQQVTIRGKVLDEQEAPLPGASVVVQGTARGALTGADGGFVLEAPSADATLLVTRIGYATETVPLAGRTSIVVRLRRAAVQLDEIVVVGYGTQRRGDVTGSVASVGAEQLESRPSVNVVQALQGVVPGVVVRTTGAGAEPNLQFQIRGRSSITASNAPLIVIDGLPYAGALSEIPYSDIASIDVLKDASAAAIYGSRGSNGVVLITTKKGAPGAPRLTYDGYTGTQRIAEKPRLMTGAEFAAFKCERLASGQECETVLTPTELSNLQAGRSADWIDLATRTGLQQQHTLAIAGGAEGTRYYVAGSLLDIEGVARGDEYQRYTMRVNLDQQVTPWLDLGTSTQLSQSDRSGEPGAFDDAFFMNPLANPYDDKGVITVTPWPEDPFFSNPLQGLLVIRDDVTRRVLTSNYLQAALPFVRGLTFRINAGLDYASAADARYYGRNTRTGETRQGLSITDDDTRFDWTAENILRYARTFGPHSLDLTGLYGAQGSRVERNRLRAEGFPNDVLTYYQAHVAALVQPSYSVAESRLVSQMGRLNYSYDGRYLLTLTARRDGFSGFGRNQRYGVFPSVAVGWNIAQERFWPFQTLDVLKLRASYGQNGNQAIRPYETLSKLREQSYLDGETTAPGFIPATLGNPNLRWETTTAFNVGADFGVWKDRVRGSIDVYDKDTDDLLLDRTISAVHGITNITENIGSTRNKGVELQISTTNVRRANFSWSTDFNIARNRNEITDLYGDGKDDLVNGWFLGRPITVNYHYVYDGIWQEGEDIANSAQPKALPGDVRIRDLDGDGQITPEDRTFIGSLDPSYTAGLNNTLRYRSLSLSFFLHSVQGITRDNYLLDANQVWGEVRRNILRIDTWSPQNPGARLPANREGSNPLGVNFYEDAGFVRLKDVTLSYEVPESLLTRVRVGGLRLYVNGRNLWTRTEWTGLDPELSAQRAIPLERSVIAGLNVRL